DEPEIVEPRVHVEGEAVAGDPARDAHADGANLLVADPGARQPGNAARVQAVAGDGPDHHVFEIADVAMNVAAVGSQIQDRVSDDLTGPVIRDVAAAPCF